MTEVKGFFFPRTAGGRSSLIPSPPWYYSGDLLTVEYRTDPARVAELLPAPLELAEEDPGAVALIWADWQSCSSRCGRSTRRRSWLSAAHSRARPTHGVCTSGSTKTSPSAAASIRATPRNSVPCGRPAHTRSPRVHPRSVPAVSSAPHWPPATDGWPRLSSPCAKNLRPTGS